VFIIWVEAETFMAGTLLSPFLGIDPRLCMALVILPIIIYTYLGGFRAVVMTDVLQFGFMGLFMIVLAVTAITSASSASSGSIVHALSNIAPPWSGAGHMFNLGFLGWLFPLILLVGYIPGWLIEQDLSLRMQAAKSTKDARKASWLGFLLIGIFVIILPAIVAFCSLVVFPPTAGADGAMAANAAVGANGLGIISAFIGKLPVALAVFMVIGIIASQMSTLDTFANVSALPIAHDILDPILKRKNKSEKVRFETARIVSVAVLVIGLGLAFLSENLNDVYYISSGVLSASIAVQVFFMFWRRITLPAVISSAIVGFVGTVFGYFYEYGKLAFMGLKGDLPGFLQPSMGYNYIAFGVILSVITIIVVSLCTKKDPPEKVAFAFAAPTDDYKKFAVEAQN
jgi:solute:Na+ symporter, SSS family